MKKNAIIFLSFYIFPQNPLQLFIVDKKMKKPMLIEFPISMSDIVDIIKKTSFNSSVAFSEKAWCDLGKMLTEKLEKLIPEDALCIINPHGILYFLPFHILNFGEKKPKPWILRNSFSYIPSLSIFRYCTYINKAREKSFIARTIASFGVEFEEEAKAVAKFFKCKPILGSKIYITEKIVRKFSENKDVIHFSCHGTYFPTFTLKLGSNKRTFNFTGNDVLKLVNLKSNLAVLSACHSGHSYIDIRANEFYGFPNYFFQAGTPSLLLSLWEINPGFALEFMNSFYEKWTSGDNKAEALRKSVSEAISKKHTDVENWGSFILYGDYI
jgi:hypothetical protein